MREIEFRGKRKDNGEWVYGYYVELFDANKNEKSYRIYTGIAEKDIGEWYEEFYEVVPETVGQYVGTGEYGRIYEGMKLFDDYAEEYCTIEYDEENCSFRLCYEGYTEMIESLDGLQIIRED